MTDSPHASQPRRSPAKAKSRTRQSAAPPPAARTRKTPEPPSGSRELKQEIAGLLLLSAAIILFLSLVTYKGSTVLPTPDGNWIGKAGSWIAEFALQGFGYSAYVATFALAAIGLVLGMRRPISLKIRGILGFCLGVPAFSILLNLLISESERVYNPGGVVGRLAGDLLIPAVGTVGLGILAGLVLVLAVVMATQQPPIQAAIRLGTGLAKGLRVVLLGLVWLLRQSGQGLLWAGSSIATAWRRFKGARRERQARREALAAAAEPGQAPEIEQESPPQEAGPVIASPERLASDVVEATGEPGGADDAEPSFLDRGEKQLTIERRRRVAFGDTHDTEAPPDEPEETDGDEEIGDFDADLDPDSPPEIVDRRPPRASSAEIDGASLVLEPEDSQEEYHLPSLSLLDYNPEISSDFDREQLFANARLLEQTLLDYKIEGRVKEIHPGPVITMYEFAPARGTKLSKITNLEDDLAMALAAQKVRIVAPIPGKSVVGIEVPSTNRETVYLKELIGHKVFTEGKSKLTMALGKDIFGYPVVTDLQKMPHLLIAGATGSGKSVGVNGMILSVLFRCTPDEVRMILIDPKRLEFNFYEGIPHLLLPVVTDPKQAALALGWVVHEMDTRYQLLSEWGVKNIDSYNKLVRTLQESSARKGGDLEKMAEEFALNEGGDAATIARKLKFSPMPSRMPFILVVIDELADLMMVAGKDVEISIARLAQLARASGIHLIVATQRPSTDVLTGLIKNNFPARISFRVSQKVDSRVILDQNGAEALLGRGDMLFIAGGGNIRRVHGAFVSEKETRRVVSFVKKQRKATYQNDILDRIEAQAEAAQQAQEEGLDSEYDKAVAIVCETGKASISMLQRKLRVGYNRAARMIEKMEEDGVVGPSDGVRGRPVYGRPLPK